MIKIVVSTLLASLALALSGCTSTSSSTQTKASPKTRPAVDTRFYEMRIYYAAPGKLDELNARFRNHTLGLFEKHGMQNIGYFTPVENSDNRLIYILAYPSREARAASWKSFGEDPAWVKARNASEANGKLVAKAESIFLKATDYSPLIQPTKARTPRFFALRTYTASPGNLANLNARFRDHTVELFNKYGMEQPGYWVPTETKDGSDNKLIYLLAYKNRAAHDQAFADFRADANWVKAREASEKNAGGSLTTKVEELFLVPTDYSPMK